jgi:hypothetical protein
VTAMAPVLSADNVCVGFLLKRGPAGIAAYDRDAHPLGIFPTEEKAAQAVLAASEGDARCIEGAGD